MTDIRDVLFETIESRRFRVALTAEAAGVFSGVAEAQECAQRLGLVLELQKKEGELLLPGQQFGTFTGTPKQIAVAEEQIIGTLAKTSGIATAARRATELAGGRVRIVSGSWKKMPPPMKGAMRRAITAGGAAFRICDAPMLYIDKNFIRMFGSVSAALAASSGLSGLKKVIQIKGQQCSVEDETLQAALGGADILMVDTGRLEDLQTCQQELRRVGYRERVQVAFAGNVRLEEIPRYLPWQMDILCIGKDIVDARLLDMRLDVVEALEA